MCLIDLLPLGLSLLTLQRDGVHLTRVWFVACLVCSGIIGQQPSHAAEPQGKRYALLIGINDYLHLEDLHYCVQDQESLRDQLVLNGFPRDQITLMHDTAEDARLRPIQHNIERQLRLTLDRCEENDLLLVAFSGHGIHPANESYLCPQDADLEDAAATMVALDKLYARLEKCPAKFKLLVVDACRNDPTPKNQRSARSAESVKDFAKRLEQPPQGILLLASCKPGQVSREEQTFGHGVFMHYVLEGLRGQADAKQGNQDGRVSVLEMFKYASAETDQFVKKKYADIQTPQLKGDVTGDFNLGERTRWTRITVPDDFRTIKAAMQAAEEGATITVQPGIYEESITLKSGVRLIGADKSRVIVRSKEKNGSALTAFTCTSGEVRWLTLEGGSSESAGGFVVFLLGSKVLLAECIIRSEDGKGVGIGCSFEDQSTVKGCRIEGCRTGIVVSNAKTAPSLIDNQCIGNNGDGIVFYDSAAGTARGNECRSNKHSGIAIQGAASPSLISNRCQENAQNGIAVFGEGRITAEDNRCDSNGWSGISVYDEKSSATLLRNKCFSNKGSGIDIWKKAKATITESECRDNDLGIAVNDEETFATIVSNQCFNNRSSGIAVTDQAQGVIRKNECRSNGLDGILVRQSGATLEDNRCIDNKETGIIIFDSSNADAEGNVCERNSKNGLVFGNDSSGTVKGNRCHQNSWGGMILGTNSNVNLFNNTCTDNAKNGFQFNDGAKVNERGNVATGNGYSDKGYKDFFR